jgi:glycosyltransferase involved in cell wall biosynthesis
MNHAPPVIAPVDAEHRLRLAVLADFDGPHARAWLRWFVARGHDVHAVSFYEPAEPVPGVTLHALRAGAARRAGGAPAAYRTGRLPRGIVRLAHAMRYRKAGLARVARSIAPDVFHGHFVVEHGFYGALAGVRPYVVTAWGSDILVEPGRDPVSRWIARSTLRRADLLTSNNAYMAERMVDLGARRDRVVVVTLGADREFLDGGVASVNLAGPSSRAPVVLSTRAHEPLYNIGDIVDAFARVARGRAGARLVVAHGGSLTEALRARASAGDVTFTGFLGRDALRDAMLAADVFVSVPSSDGTSVALLQAMASGCFPVVSDLPTQREWIEDAVNGFLVPLHRPDILAARIDQALADPGLRRSAAVRNRALVEERGLNEQQMATMERLYGRLRDERR